jgi:hypothetical protein
MKDSIETRLKLVKESTEKEDLIKHLCPFFEKGGHPDCISCKKTEEDLEECKEVYLSRITKVPLDLWEPDFDKLIVESRNKIPLKEIVGIGVNCDSCYMYDKCPLYKSGYICAIDWNDEKPDTPEKFYDFLVDTQFERVRRATVFEKVDGGVPDANLSNEMDRLSGFIADKANLGRERLSISVEASGAARSGGGILSKIFGGGSTESLPASETKSLPTAAESLRGADIEEAVIIEAVPRKSKRHQT